MKFFDALRGKLTRKEPVRTQSYAAAQHGHLTSDWMAAGTSQDSEL